MKLKKMIAIMLIGSLSAVHTVSAKTKKDQEESLAQTEHSTTEQDQQMDEILLKVKQVFHITDEYKNFDFSYYETRNPIWSFYWNTDRGVNIQVNCDSFGNILYFYKSNNINSTQIAKYLKSELTKKADQYLKEIAPDLVTHVKYRSSNYNGMYSNTYSFVYERYENNLFVPDNSIIMNLDAKTGELVSYTANWDYNVKFSKEKVNISFDEAKEKLSKELKFDLVYHEDTNPENNKMTGKLIYEAKDNYLSVDAYSGKVYSKRYENSKENGLTVDASFDMGESAKADGERETLSPEEIAKLEELKGLKTKEEVLLELKKQKAFWIDSKATVLNSSLRKMVSDRSKPDEVTYVWNIWVDAKEEDYYQNEIYYQPYYRARINAKTGEILSFSASTKVYSNESKLPKLAYTKEEGKKIAIDFIKEQYSELSKEIEFAKEEQGYVIGYEDGNVQFGGATYIFYRTNRGIPFPSNHFSVSVDFMTGKIYNFYYKWYSDIRFESPDNRITKEEAIKKYLSNEKFQLYYEIFEKCDENVSSSDSRLVYSTENIRPKYIDAITGKQVYFDGEEVEESKNHKYVDIKNSPYRREIELLTDMGIVFKSECFYPEKAITIKELTELVTLFDVYWNSKDLLTGTGTITREAAARFAIRALKLEYIAELEIYKEKYKDTSEIKQSYIGYAILAESLGLLDVTKENEFRPKDKLTRQEAAKLLIQMCSYYRY